jgi:hypothetical protein
MQRISLLLALVFAFAVPSAPAQDFKKQVIYQVVTDRFFDGDSANDNPAESPGLFDGTHTNWQAYWGGDLGLARGQQRKSELRFRDHRLRALSQLLEPRLHECRGALRR